MAVPKARKSSNNATQIRVPRTHGLPKQTLGSTEILLKSGFTAPDPFELQDTSLSDLRTRRTQRSCSSSRLQRITSFVPLSGARSIRLRNRRLAFTDAA